MLRSPSQALRLTSLLSLCALIGLTACRSQKCGASSVQHPEDTASPPATLWRDATSLTADQWQTQFGSLDDCDPDQKLPGLGPSHRQFWVGGMPYCLCDPPPTADSSAYRIQAIGYSKGRPVVVRLEPTDDEVPLNDAILEKWELPRLKHRFPPPNESIERRLPIKFQRASVDDSLEDGTLIQVALMPSQTDASLLGHVRLVVYSSTWPDVTELLRENPSQDPPPESEPERPEHMPKKTKINNNVRRPSPPDIGVRKGLKPSNDDLSESMKKIFQQDAGLQHSD